MGNPRSAGHRSRMPGLSWARASVRSAAVGAILLATGVSFALVAGAVSVLNASSAASIQSTLLDPYARQGSLRKHSPTPLPARRASGLSRVLWPLPVQRHSLPLRVTSSPRRRRSRWYRGATELASFGPRCRRTRVVAPCTCFACCRVAVRCGPCGSMLIRGQRFPDEHLGCAALRHSRCASARPWRAMSARAGS